MGLAGVYLDVLLWRLFFLFLVFYKGKYASLS